MLLAKGPVPELDVFEYVITAQSLCGENKVRSWSKEQLASTSSKISTQIEMVHLFFFALI